MFDGGCLCGQVRYRLASTPMFTNACHCRDCQRFTGSAMAVNAMIETDRIASIGAVEPLPAEGADLPARCPARATRLWGHIATFGPAIAFVYVGTLDEGERLVPDAHFFTRSRHPWVTLPEGVPAYDTLPDDDAALWSAAVRGRLDAALAGAGGGR